MNLKKMNELRKENMIPNISAKEKMVAANLNSYTEGDADFLLEFAQNILDNLLTLKSQLPQTLLRGNKNELSELAHMVKPTLEILGQEEILKILTNLRSGGMYEPSLTSLLKSVNETIILLKNIIKRAATPMYAEH
ncbi:hypothetical protein [Ekhidna sp.]|uniref:hypothetical protein n=1 Tax=Ekhidna sp. TaxID=2608089 RepID=UPI003296C35A